MYDSGNCLFKRYKLLLNLLARTLIFQTFPAQKLFFPFIDVFVVQLLRKVINVSKFNIRFVQVGHR